MSRSTALACFLAIFAASSTSHASTEGAPVSGHVTQDHSWVWSRGTVGIAGHFGAGAPTGILGGSVEVTPAPWLTIAPGVGVAPLGYQLALMSRFRVVADTMGYGFGFGVSEGGYQSKRFAASGGFEPYSAGTESIKTWSHAWFGNVEASIEQRHENGLSWRAYAGVGAVLNRSGYECASYATGSGIFRTSPSAPGCDRNQGNVVPYAGFSIGWAFGM